MSLMRSVYMRAIVTSMFFCSLTCTSMGYALEREQGGAPSPSADEYEFVSLEKKDMEETAAVAPETKGGFWHYFGRIVMAPFAVFVTFPLDEETDIYQTYVKHVNKYTGREIKKDSFATVRKTPSTLMPEDEDHAENLSLTT